MRINPQSTLFGTFAIATTLLCTSGHATLTPFEIPEGRIDVQDPVPDRSEIRTRYITSTDLFTCDKHNTLNTFIFTQTLSDDIPPKIAAIVTNIFEALPQIIKDKLDQRNIAPETLVKFVNSETEILINNLLATSPASDVDKAYRIATIEVTLETVPDACPFTGITPMSGAPKLEHTP